MINIIKKFFLTGENSTREMCLKQHGFTYIACEPFTGNKARIQKFKAIENIRHIYQNKLEKACFEANMTYEDYKDPPRKTALTKYRVTKHLKLLVAIRVVDINVDQYQFTNLFVKYLETPLLTEGLEYIALHSSITKKFKSYNVYSFYPDKI